MALKTLHQHNEERRADEEVATDLKTGLACPKCNKELIDIGGIQLTSSPPHVKVRCSSCSFTGDRLA